MEVVSETKPALTIPLGLRLEYYGKIGLSAFMLGLAISSYSKDGIIYNQWGNLNAIGALYFGVSAYFAKQRIETMSSLMDRIDELESALTRIR